MQSQHPVLQWYAGLNAKYLDIIADVGVERFFIEGDSLLLECFSNQQLDFDPGFQLLHAVYLVEYYLSNLIRTGGNIDIVFFDRHANLCVPHAARSPSKYLLARAAIIRHLSHHAEQVQVLNYDHLESPLFEDYLQKSGCFFAFCSDGANYAYPKDHNSQLRGHEVASVSSEGTGNRIGLRNIILNLCLKKVDVALLNGLTWQENKVFAFIIERKKATDAARESALTIPAKCADGDRPGVVGLSSAETPEAWSLRLSLIFSAISSSGQGLHLSKHLLSTIVHAVYLDILPLSARKYGAVSFSEPEEEDFGNYIEQLSVALRQQLTSNEHNTDFTITDVIDGRLLRTIICAPTKAFEGLPQDCQDQVKHILVRLGSSLAHSKSRGTSVRHRTLEEIASIADSRVLPFSHPAFDPHLAPIVVETDNERREYTGKLAMEVTHFHSRKKLNQHELKPKDPWVDRRLRQREQRNMAQLTAYATSLTGGPLNAQLIIAEKPKDVKHGKNAKSAEPSKKSAKASAIIDRNKDRLALKHVAKVAKKPITPVAAAKSKLSVTDILEHKGPDLDRSMDAKDDPRVAFKPDGWQIKVLNQLDAGNSLLVVAPTSSGKTFISFYAMEKVLRAGDDDVLIYVAPTKALVNQIAAEIMSKYKKNYRPGSGKSYVSIYTRDYRVNKPTKAQILVTVPHMLSILMMSPANKLWFPRVKSIIFDEVHSISNADDGLAWEQLIMSAPCQIIALSATVGNVEAFSKWLSFARDGSGSQFELIEHALRYSDLRKFIYKPTCDRVDLTEGLPKIWEQAPLDIQIDNMRQIHPMACITHPERGLPPDLSLESQDCLSLWRAMQEHKTVKFSIPHKLDPSSRLLTTTIVKADVIKWGDELKEVFGNWMSNPESPAKVVLSMLSKSVYEEFDEEEEEEQKPETKQDKTYLKGNMSLLCDLRAKNALPAILFNYNRKECEDMTRDLLQQLQGAEQRFKATNDEWKARMAKYRRWKAADALRKKQTELPKSAKDKASRDTAMSKMERQREEFGSRENAMVNFDPDKPLDEFSFANIKKSDDDLFNSYIKHFERVHIPDYLIQAFRIGLGVHHSGLNKQYRMAVEVFFRRGFLTVVIATGTLSLGINMPCKTVVFAGDSVFLNALNYRQASGRAGRRGFDLLGNVIFHNMPTERALRLISSRLPDINGHFPMTTLFVLRLFTLLHGTSDAPYAMKMVDVLLSRARLYQESVAFKNSVQHHVRFSIEYLRSQGLINARGHPLNFAGCVSHLYYAEKGALAFHALLKEGYFTTLCDEYRHDNPEMALRKLMQVLAHLFGRRAMRPVEREDEKSRVKNSVSIVFLKPLPAEAETILKQHNGQTLQTYMAYVSTYVEQHCTDADDRLPLSKLQIKPTTPTEKGAAALQGQWQSSKLRSTFVSLSGHGDKFDSIADLCDGVREGVFLEKVVIPNLDLVSDTNMLNAYLYDFYIHGSINALADANRVPKGDVW